MRPHEAGTLLITGISGYVGSAVAALALASGHRVTGTYLHHTPTAPALAPCRLVRAPVEEIPAMIASLRPDVVLHTAAAWSTPAEAQAVIVEGTRGIAQAVAETAATFIHMSTDLVFDGEHGPYTEESRPAPVNFYGAAKAAAEQIVAELTPRAVVVRTSLVTCFDPPDPRTQPIVDALEGRRAPVTLFTDEYRCPVRVEDLAAALVELIDRVNGVDSRFSGFLHIAGPERLSRYELGLRIARFYGRDPEPGIIPGLARDSGQPRPRDCALSIALAQRTLHTLLQPLP
ncbi:MAG: SDR family oxidoreductase [Nitrososphaerales archaeon]